MLSEYWIGVMSGYQPHMVDKGPARPTTRFRKAYSIDMVDTDTNTKCDPLVAIQL